MKVLFTNVQLDHRTGTEIVVRDLALSMSRRGHEIAVYTPALGVVSEELIDNGVPVVDSVDRVPFTPDIVHGHHHEPTMNAITRFIDTPAIWVCHDRHSYNDIPPQHPRIRRHVAVDLSCRERIVDEAQIPEGRLRLIHNAVDLGRFQRRSELPRVISRAAVFSNYAKSGGYMDAVAEACRKMAVPLDVIGEGSGTSSDAPERLLGRYDVVFAKARCALEALATGCAVVLLDHVGLGPMVNTRNMEPLRDWNFGARCLQAHPTPERIVTQLESYDPDDAAKVTDWIRAVAHLDGCVDRYLLLYAEAMAEEPPPRLDPERSPLDLALQYAATLEQRMRALQVPIVMLPLPPLTGADVRVRIGEVRRSVRPGSTFGIEVTVSNDSSEVIATVGPTPVNLSYHWIPLSGTSADTTEGLRTALPRPLFPGASSTVRMTVAAPDEVGEYGLRVTLVQESVFWFDELTPPTAAWLSVDVRPDVNDGSARPTMSLAAVVASRATADLCSFRDGVFDGLGFVDDNSGRTLVFAENAAFIRRAAANPAVACILTSNALAHIVPAELGVLTAPDPKRAFFEVHNWLATNSSFFHVARPTSVAPSARVHASAYIDPNSVCIGEGCVIEPNVVIVGPAVVGARTRIDAGAVVGSSAFQTSGRTGAYVELLHVGGVNIGEDCHIYSNATIARGVFRPSTEIGDRCQVGANAFISHQCHLGANVFVGHGATINGRSIVGDGAWIGPGAIVSNEVNVGPRARVALGSTVIQDVPEDGRVAGLPALDQHIMFRHAATVRRKRH